MQAAISTRSGEYAVIDAAVPSAQQTAIGIVLLDPESDRFHVRLRRDWAEIFNDPEDVEYFEALEDDLRAQSDELGGRLLLEQLEASLSNGVRISDRQSVPVHNWASSLTDLYRRHIQARVLPFRTHLPLYSARAAAGKFGEHMEVEPEDWIEARPGLRLTEEMFVIHVTGHSMEPQIPDGSLCIFRAGVKGSRTGRLLLIENFGEPGENRYTVKRYRREGKRVFVVPINPAYEKWEIHPSDERIRVLAEFVDVLD